MKTNKAAHAAQTQVAQPRTGEQTGLTKEDLRILREVFPKDRLGVKVQSFSKDRTKAMLVLYLQHTDVQNRLEEVDPGWSLEILQEERSGDTVYVRTRMTLKGVSRENVGEGGDPKAAYSDALKRCAMLFGVGRYLYDSSTVWTAYDDQKDRFRNWTVDDYESALNAFSRRTERSEKPKKSAQAESGEPRPGLTATAGSKAAASKASATRPREELNRVLMNLYRPYLTHFPQTQFAQFLQSRYNVNETRLMTVEQLEDLVQYMEQKLKSVA